MTPWSPTARQAAAGAALCCAAALVTACGSGSPAAAPRHTAAAATSTHGAASGPGQGGTGTPSSPPGTGPATSPASGSSGSGGTPASPAACLTRYLRVAAAAPQGTAGSVYLNLDFTNLGQQPCTLYGYPGVSLAAGTPVRQVGRAATENPVPARRLVTLQPGGVASALLRIVDAGNYSPMQCHPVQTSWLQVYPPNQTAVAYAAFHSTGCAGPVGLLSVDTVQP